jgi:hypothetical protein
MDEPYGDIEAWKDERISRRDTFNNPVFQQLAKVFWNATSPIQ